MQPSTATVLTGYRGRDASSALAGACLHENEGGSKVWQHAQHVVESMSGAQILGSTFAMADVATGQTAQSETPTEDLATTAGDVPEPNRGRHNGEYNSENVERNTLTETDAGLGLSTQSQAPAFGRPAETSRRRETVVCRPLISEDLPSFARRALSENYSSDESRTTQDQGVKNTSMKTKAMLALLLIAQTAMPGCLYMRFVVLA